MKPVLPPSVNMPRPIRFSDEDEAALRELKNRTGLSISNLIRRSCRYTIPRFLDGRINILTLLDEKKNVRARPAQSPE